jgi:hypothetical protein
MILTNTDLKVFVDKIRLKPENMPQYREQVTRLQEKLEDKIKNDQRTGLKVTRAVISGSWKKHTILRPTGDTPIDIDLVLFIGGDENIINDVSKLHDFIVSYLEEIVVIQYSLRNLQTIIIDRTIRVLCQAEFLCKQRYTVPEFGNSFNRLVQIGIGHGVLWCRGIMSGGVQGVPSSPCTFRKTEIN